MTRKELLLKEKEMIKLETINIRTLKERNKKLAQNHALTYSNMLELQSLRQQNSIRHYWYFRLKNLYSIKHNRQILKEFNKDYPDYTALYLNEKGIEEYIINLRKGN